MVTAQINLLIRQFQIVISCFSWLYNMHLEQLYLAYSRLCFDKIQSCEYLIQYHADRIQRDE